MQMSQMDATRAELMSALEVVKGSNYDPHVKAMLMWRVSWHFIVIEDFHTAYHALREASKWEPGLSPDPMIRASLLIACHELGKHGEASSLLHGLAGDFESLPPDLLRFTSDIRDALSRNSKGEASRDL